MMDESIDELVLNQNLMKVYQTVKNIKKEPVVEIIGHPTLECRDTITHEVISSYRAYEILEQQLYSRT